MKLIMLFLLLWTFGCKADDKKKTPQALQPGVDDPATAEMPQYDVFPRTYFRPQATRKVDHICIPQSSASVEPSAAALSASFLNNCSGCHGSDGAGRDIYPSIRSLTKEVVVLGVRSGTKTMPSFSKDYYPEKDLQRDAELLASTEAIATLNTRSVAVPYAPSVEAEFAKVMQKGLRAWRHAGSRGACMSCHTPDGIDLAVGGYPNSAILRRAHGQELDADQGLAIVAMINALRSHYRLENFCDPAEFRPLQPGLERQVLSDPIAADLDLLNTLETRGLLLPGTASKTDLDTIVESFKTLDVTTIPLHVTLNRWAEDKFHDSAGVSTSEWIPELPFESKIAAEHELWIDVQNAYLEDPSASNLWSMIDAVDSLSTQRFVGSGVGERLSREKYKSVLIAQHQMRHVDINFPKLKDSKRLHRFYVWETAQIASSMLRGCPEMGPPTNLFPCWTYPPSFFAKMGGDAEHILEDLGSLVLPWMIAGWIQDPSFQLTEHGDVQIKHLHDAFASHARNISKNSPSHLLPIHQVYISAVRTIKSIEGFNKEFPYGTGLEESVVNGCWHRIGAGLHQWLTMTLPELTEAGLTAVQADLADQRHVTALHKLVNSMNLLFVRMVAESAQRKAPECEGVKGLESGEKWMQGIYSWNQNSGSPSADVAKVIEQFLR